MNPKKNKLTKKRKEKILASCHKSSLYFICSYSLADKAMEIYPAINGSAAVQHSMDSAT